MDAPFAQSVIEQPTTTAGGGREKLREQISQALETKPTLWIEKYAIKTEAGLPIELDGNHRFMRALYNDMSPLQVWLKAPQIGASVAQIIKTMWVAKKLKRDIIYTLPTSNDVNDMAGGKINRLVAQNPILGKWVKEHDTVEQKTIGDNIIYYRGTWTAKQAMMVSSQLNVHDEVDASKADVITQYETRLQATSEGWRWYFSHPSSQGVGVSKYWDISDQMHWFVTCDNGHRHFLNWPDSIDPDRKVYQCKECKVELTDRQRIRGQWYPKYEQSADRPFRGYWINQLMCPWISAAKILDDFKHKPEEYFYNYVLALPYIGGGNKLTRDALMQNLIPADEAPAKDERVVIGVDTGLRLDYVMGTENGLFYHGDCDDYKTLDDYMKRWPRAIVIMDAGGDLIGSRAFQEHWSGRVYLAYFIADRKEDNMVEWYDRTVKVERNRMIQLCVDEFIDKRLPILGTENDWHDYWLDWNNLTRVELFDTLTGESKGRKWVRNGRDHRALATTLWRTGIMKFSQTGAIHTPGKKVVKGTDPEHFDWSLIKQNKTHDWRKLG